MQKEKSKEFLQLCEKYGVDPNNVNEVLSYEAACEIMGVDPNSRPIVDGCVERHRKRLTRDYELSIIAEALRADLSGQEVISRDVNYLNSNERKEFAVFKVQATEEKPSGSRLSCDDFFHWYSYSVVGVRLSFPGNYDAIVFFAKHFLELHVDHLLYT